MGSDSAAGAPPPAGATQAGNDAPAAAPPTGSDAPAAAPPVGNGSPAAASPPLASPAPPAGLSSPEHQRYQRLRVETLRLMIEAARRALPIGPFQQRIDRAATTALEDVSEAGDLMEQIAADLGEAIADADR